MKDPSKHSFQPSTANGLMDALNPWTRTVLGTTHMLKSLILAAAVMASQTLVMAAGPDPVYLGEAAHFTILAGAAITTTGGGIIDGDVGAYPIAGSAIGIPPVQVNGTIYARDAAGRTPVPTGDQLNPNGGNLGGLNLPPDLYKITATAYITGSDVTLTGGPDDVWIFMCDQDLVVGSGIKVILAGCTRAKNVFWQVGTSATIGTGAVFKGTIIADQAVVMESTSTIEGRALAFSAGVTFNGTGGTLPDHEGGIDLDPDNNSGISPDFANTFNVGTALPVAMSADNTTVTNSNYLDVISATITSGGIVDGGEDYPLDANKTATVIAGGTIFVGLHGSRFVLLLVLYHGFRLFPMGCIPPYVLG